MKTSVFFGLVVSLTPAQSSLSKGTLKISVSTTTLVSSLE